MLNLTKHVFSTAYINVFAENIKVLLTLKLSAVVLILPVNVNFNADKFG